MPGLERVVDEAGDVYFQHFSLGGGFLLVLSSFLVRASVLSIFFVFPFLSLRVPFL